MILADWKKVKIVKYKDGRDIATKTDLAVEKFLQNKILAKWPSHGVWGEEGERVNPTSPYQWLIDPIDGTKYYIKQAPFFYTQLALNYKGKPVLALLYNPVSHQLFSAIKGGGTWLNDKKVSLGAPMPLSRAVIDVDLGGFNRKNATQQKWLGAKLTELMAKSYRVRMTSGVFCIYLVTGAVDAYVYLFTKDQSKFQDLAPRLLLMLETGYRSKWLKAPSGEDLLIVARGALLKEIEKILK